MVVTNNAKLGRVARLKVLYLVPPSTSKEGLSKYSFISEEIEALVDAGVEAHIVSPHEGHNYCGVNVTKYALPKLSLWQSFSALRFLLANLRVTAPLAMKDLRSCVRCARLEMLATQITRMQRIDLIHSHFGWPNGVGGMFVRNSAKKPLVTSIRGMDILLNEAIGYGNRRDSFFDNAFRKLLKTADAMICFSDYVRKEALALGADSDKTVTVPKGVDLARFTSGTSHTDARRRLNLEDKFTVLSVGGLIPRKGMDHIVRAIAEADRDLQCVICGTGPELTALLRLAVSLGIEDKILFRGQIPRNEIPCYFSAADVFILASINEAAGNVLIEAAASGRPVITTSSGGPPEYVMHQEYGYIVAPGDVAALAERIQEFFDDPKLCTEYGQRAREIAARNFGYDRMIRKILSVYECSRALPNSGRTFDE
jgi:glycosyltransferase involved in cell wall biosynthesis